MAEPSEAVGEKDDSHNEGSPRTVANINNGPRAAVTNETDRVDGHSEKERDDSGLPVNAKAPRPVPHHETDSEPEEAQAYGTPHEQVSRTVTPRPPEIIEEHKATISEKPSPEVVEANESIKLPPTPAQLAEEESQKSDNASHESAPVILTDAADKPRAHAHHISASATAPATVVNEKRKGNSGPFSEHSHQALASSKDGHDDEKGEEEEWKTMPAFAPYDMYDDDDRLFAREEHDSDNEDNAYSGLGGAGKGYTRIQVDEDAKSATSMDENTNYLFKPKSGTELHDEDENQRDPLTQLQATKTLLSEAQRIAYVGMTRLAISKMVNDLEDLESTKKTKKEKAVAVESMNMWAQKMMVRLYGHMDISSSEQIMIEQLAQHGVEMGDMTPALMHNARVENPMAKKDGDDGSKDDVKNGSKVNIEHEAKGDQEDESDEKLQVSSQDDLNGSSEEPIKNDAEENYADDLMDGRNTSIEDSTPSKTSGGHSQTPSTLSSKSKQVNEAEKIGRLDSESGVDDANDPVPEYKEHEDETKPEYLSPEHLGTGENIDIDLRWTVLCDLFLVLLNDSVYDARSRLLLERAGEALQVSWVEISRFEKRVTDSLEMEETGNKETWDEAEHLENRRKGALRRRYLMMGLATVGGSLVIGLSAGVLAPVIGAGLAAGFTTIGVTGTTAALTGAGASAVITTGAVGIGGSIGMKASHRRTGAVKTFE